MVAIARNAAVPAPMKPATMTCPTVAPIAGAYFSVKTGTVMRKSQLPLRKWVFAIYLHLTSLKGVSSMKLHRDIGVSQKSAWFMLQRIREAWGHDDLEDFTGPVEVGETYMGSRERNKHKGKKLTEPRRVWRRPFCLSHAAMSDCSSMA